MTIRIFSRTGPQGEALPETTVCYRHLPADGRVPGYVNTAENSEADLCTVCGDGPNFWGSCGVPECTDCLPRFDRDNNELPDPS